MPEGLKSASAKGSAVVVSANTSWYLFNFRRNTISAFLSAGYEVYAISPRDEYVPKLEALGCRYLEIPIRPSSVNPIYEARTVLRYVLLYRKIKPKGIFHFTTKANLYGSLAARLLGLPYVNNISGLGRAFDSESLLTGLVRLMYRFTLNKAKRIFFQNLTDHDYIVGLGLVSASKSEVLPGSGVDLSHFQPHFREFEKVFTFVFAGRLLLDKGLRYFADAIRILRKQGLNFDCWIYGFLDKNDPNYVLEAELRAWENEGLIYFGGSLADVREAFMKADCVVLPSYYREGIPRSLLEAAAMAKPIITTDWIGCNEVVTQGVNGYLCPIKDSQALADEMIRMSQQTVLERRRMCEAGRRLVENRFSEEIIITKYLKVLES